MSTPRRNHELSTVANSRRPLRASYEAQQKAASAERRRKVGGVVAIVAAGGLVLAATLSAGETTRSEQDIIECAKADLGEAATRGIEVATLSDGALAQFAANCDPSAVDPLSPVHAQDHYLQFADDIRP